MRPVAVLVALALAAWGCQKTQPAAVCPPVQCPEPQPTRAEATRPERKDAVELQRVEPTTGAPHPAPLSVCEAKGRLPLDAAREFYDRGQYEQSLSCAAQASAFFPNDALAHTERGNALSALGRYDEAKLAYARALAIDPDGPDALLGAAHLYGITLPSTRELDELASTYAERGLEIARAQRDEELALELGRISAMVFNDLGMAKEALDRAAWVLSSRPKDAEALYEKAVALFELCRFLEAKAAFEALLQDPERRAHAHHHLGLLAEREGQEAVAAKHFQAARKAKPEDFPEPVLLSVADFEAELKKAVAALPGDMRKDLGDVPVAAEDVPKVEDLTSGDPPLSPTILGLFRGPPLGESCESDPTWVPGTPCRSVVLYRKNLARAVKTKADLVEQVRVTLLHEVGHLRGEDDGELAARGLE